LERESGRVPVCCGNTWKLSMAHRMYASLGSVFLRHARNLGLRCRMLAHVAEPYSSLFSWIRTSCSLQFVSFEFRPGSGLWFASPQCILQRGLHCPCQGDTGNGKVHGADRCAQCLPHGHNVMGRWTGRPLCLVSIGSQPNTCHPLFILPFPFPFPFFFPSLYPRRKISLDMNQLSSASPDQNSSPRPPPQAP
jgi:hypothetical protein